MDRFYGLIRSSIFFFIFSLFQINNFKSQEFFPICVIQGESFTSPMLGVNVLTNGVVTADLDDTWKRGFFMQIEDCDSSASTSDGIFVYLGERTDVVKAGDIVEVQGVVNEYYGLTEIITNPGSITVISSGNSLPQPMQLNPPFNNELAAFYFESREGMYVHSSHVVTVGPTDADNRSWFINADMGINHVFQDDEMGTGEIICVDDAGIFKVYPDVKVGDQILGLSGVLDFAFGNYCLQLIAQTEVLPSRTTTSQNTLLDIGETGQFTIGTFNLWNLFDVVDDPLTDDAVISPFEYQRRLEKRALAIHDELNEPELLGVQEVESLEVLQDLADRPEIYSNYGIVWENSLDQRGLDTGLLYNQNRWRVLSYETRQGCTALQDGLGPDGNQNIYQPVNEITCDLDGDGILDGNRLFSRLPLLVNLEFCSEICMSGSSRFEQKSSSDKLWLIVNHWKSKSEDTSETPYTLPRRLEQSQFVVSIAQEILALEASANIIVLGDMNDYPDSSPLMNLVHAGFFNIVNNIPHESRYTYNYHGVSQILDHILINSGSEVMSLSVNPIHINSDYPYSYYRLGGSATRSSDHDPLVVIMGFVKYKQFLPIILN